LKQINEMVGIEEWKKLQKQIKMMF
jgi:hypothetical protein